jgi:hypothetical protein
LPPAVTLAISGGVDTITIAESVGNTVYAAESLITGLVNIVATVTDGVAVSGVEITVGTSPVGHTDTAWASIYSMKNASKTVIVAWAITAGASGVALANVFCTVVCGPVSMTAADTKVVEERVGVTNVALFGEEAAWAASASVGTWSLPGIAEYSGPVWLAYTVTIWLLFGIWNALLTVVGIWSSTVLTLIVTCTVIFAAVRALPV